MKLAIMQPYFFPYLGYFQLLAVADKFVFLDDATFIKQGWVNRNRILIQGAPAYITVPIARASSFTRICETCVAQGNWPDKLLRTLAQAYARAPHRAEVLPMIAEVVQAGTALIGELATRSVLNLCVALEVHPEVVPTTRAYGNDHLKGQERVLDICTRERADIYLNSPGGKELYSPAEFLDHGVQLRFLDSALPPYRQFGETFHSRLSIIDVLMFNGVAGTRRMLNQYELVP